MGLRTASVRHPHVEVMAPALTEATQSQNFNLPSKTHLEPVSPINGYEKHKFLANPRKQIYEEGKSNNPIYLENNAIDRFVLTSERLEFNKCTGASDNATDNTIMSVSPSPMGDQENKMGVQKTGLDVSTIHKEKLSNDMDQLFNNLTSVLPETEGSDLAPNVEDIMQVIKSMEGGERLNNMASDSNSEEEEIFPMTGADLTNNLSSFEKEFLENVDVMNITIEDQQDELETVDKQKESQAKELLTELQKKHAKVERRLDFLRRRVYKMQSRMMGQHIGGEIAGVFENVQRFLKRPKDTYNSLKSTSEPPFMVSLSSSDIDPLNTTLTADNLKAMSYGSTKTLLRKLEMTSMLQANITSKQRHNTRYFGSGSLDLPTFRNSVNGAVSIPPWPIEAKSELQKVTGQLHTQLGLVQKEVDSEATESSSGGESCDEMQTYNNPHQQYLSVQKRALWKYSTERAAIAARWTWLQAQIADLEYRIRQHTDLHRQIRQTKGGVQLGGESPSHQTQSILDATLTPMTTSVVNGYRGQLPGSSPKVTADAQESVEMTIHCAARTRPLVNFKKRKLLQVSGLHAVSKKAARPSSVRCGCLGMGIGNGGPSSTWCCALCTGRTDPTRPRDPTDALARAERVALLEPTYHPVISTPEDTSQNVHLEAIMKMSEWQQKSTRMKTLKVLSKQQDRLDGKTLEHRSKKLEHRKKYGRMLKPSTISALSAKIKSKIRGRKPGRHPLNRLHRKRNSSKEPLDYSNSLADDCADEEVESIGNSGGGGPRSSDSPCSSPLLHMQSISGYNRKNRIHSYDIDNIVIPYSVAASTRVEKLQYKEILTPKWRIAEPDYEALFEIKNNGVVRDPTQDNEAEDILDEAVIARHERCELEEKKRFLSYLKPPTGLGGGRQRAHRRADSRAESSGANTPDPMSPHSSAIQQQEGGGGSPVTSPPATPLTTQTAEETAASLPSVAVMRRRTISQSRHYAKVEETFCTTPEAQTLDEITPYEKRTFPISSEAYETMLKSMPEDHLFQTNTRSQDSVDFETGGEDNFLNRKIESPDSESTESAIGDGEEDPNDPEWIDVERANRERYKR